MDLIVFVESLPVHNRTAGRSSQLDLKDPSGNASLRPLAVSKIHLKYCANRVDSTPGGQRPPAGYWTKSELAMASVKALSRLV